MTGPLLVPFGHSSVRPSEESRSGSMSGWSGLVQPDHDLGHAAGDRAGWHLWPVDQDGRQGKVTRSRQFRFGPRATGVLGDDHVDLVLLEQGKIAFDGEGASGDHRLRIGQGQGLGRGIDKAQKIVVLRGLGEGGEGLAPDGQEDATRGFAQGCDGGVKVGDMGPVVPVARLPWRAFKGDQGGSRCLAGGDGIAAHLRGEGVGGVDDMGDGFGFEVMSQPVGATKAAHADRQRLGDRSFGATGVGIDRVHASLGQSAGHLCGFGRSAQKKDARHG